MKSILQKDKKCYKCGTISDLHSHHIFAGGNRKLSEKYGLKVYLCSKHHNMSNQGIHFNRDFELEVKKDMQTCAMNHYNWTKSDFIGIIGKNYLEE